MHGALFVRGVVVIGLIAAGIAPASATDQSIDQACPGIARWKAAERTARANETDAAIAARDASRHFTAPADREQLLRRADTDQAARNAAIAASQAKGMTAGQRQAVFRHLGAVDSDNLGWLKARVKASGFPTVDEVGEQGMEAAFLLVQHADSDPAFQARMLKTLASRGAHMGVKKSDFAMLTDRVLRARGERQRYGTQFISDPAHPGRPMMGPVDDPAGLDQRRAAMDLPPIKAYECAIQATYGSPAQSASTSSRR